MKSRRIEQGAVSQIFQDSKAPSPIARRNIALTKSVDAHQMAGNRFAIDHSTPAQRSGPFNAEGKQILQFDPSCHGVDTEQPLSVQEETEFLDSLVLSVSKPKSAWTPSDSQRAIHWTPSTRKFSVIHDYDSEEDETPVLVPLKFSPKIAKTIKRVREGTPAIRKSINTQPGSRMVWDPTRKRVVENTVSPDTSQSGPHTERESLASTTTVTTKEPAQFVEVGGRHREQALCVKPQNQGHKFDPQIPPTTCVQSKIARKQSCQLSETSMRKLVNTYFAATESPKAELTRVNDGLFSGSRLAYFEPDFSEAQRPGARIVHPFRRYARLPMGQRSSAADLVHPKLGLISTVHSSAEEKVSNDISAQSSSKLPNILRSPQAAKRKRSVSPELCLINKKNRREEFEASVPGKGPEAALQFRGGSFQSQNRPEQRFRARIGNSDQGDLCPSTKSLSGKTKLLRKARSPTKTMPFRFGSTKREKKCEIRDSKIKSEIKASLSKKQMKDSSSEDSDIGSRKIPLAHYPNLLACSVASKLNVRPESDEMTAEYRSDQLVSVSQSAKTSASSRKERAEQRRGYEIAGMNAIEDWQRQRYSKR